MRSVTKHHGKLSLPTKGSLPTGYNLEHGSLSIDFAQKWADANLSRQTWEYMDNGSINCECGIPQTSMSNVA